MTARERNLSVIFGMLIFFILNLIFLPKLKQWGSALEIEKQKLEGQQLAADSWLSQADFWETRAQWLKEHQPVFTDQVSPATLVEALRTLAEQHRVTIEHQDLTEFPTSGNFSATGVTLRMSGSLESMIRWLYAVQQPEQFIVCSHFRCENVNNSASQMRWTLTLARIYRGVPSQQPGS